MSEEELAAVYYLSKLDLRPNPRMEKNCCFSLCRLRARGSYIKFENRLKDFKQVKVNRIRLINLKQ
jgi:hypothetical protein